MNFERATADYDIVRGKDALRLAEEGQGSKVITCEGADGYVGELKHIVECVRTGKPPTVVTAQDGLVSVEICESEERSVKERRVFEF